MAQIHHAESSRKQVLIIDQDDIFSLELIEQLRHHDEYAVSKCLAGSDALQWIEEQRYDLVLLEVELADIDGHEVCRLMRRRGKSMPIIMMTAAKSDADEILSLDSGANDYLSKPFQFSVLLARIRAHLRLHQHRDDAEFEIGPYIFRPSARKLIDAVNKKRIHLSEKETAILKLACRKRGEVVKRSELMEQVWGYNPGVNTHTVETHVYRLRQKIEPEPTYPTFLVTKAGGYQLVA